MHENTAVLKSLPA